MGDLNGKHIPIITDGAKSERSQETSQNTHANTGTIFINRHSVTTPSLASRLGWPHFNTGQLLLDYVYRNGAIFRPANDCLAHLYGSF